MELMAFNKAAKLSTILMKWPSIVYVFVFDAMIFIGYIQIILIEHPNGVPPAQWFTTYQLT